MSSRKKRARRSNKYETPDEQYSSGPINVARFGKNVVWQSNWEPVEFEKYQRELVEKYPEIVQAIDNLVGEIADIVCRNPPAEMMHRAWWEFARISMGIDTEAEVGPEQANAMRMIDYVQSIIAAGPPDQNPHASISEDDWSALKEKVQGLFQTLNIDFAIVRHQRLMDRSA